MKEKYEYEGAVYAFGELASAHWKASTWAISPKKAITNLKYRFRIDNNYSYRTPLEMPGALRTNI